MKKFILALFLLGCDAHGITLGVNDAGVGNDALQNDTVHHKEAGVPACDYPRHMEGCVVTYTPGLGYYCAMVCVD